MDQCHDYVYGVPGVVIGNLEGGGLNEGNFDEEYWRKGTNHGKLENN